MTDFQGKLVIITLGFISGELFAICLALAKIILLMTGGG